MKTGFWDRVLVYLYVLVTLAMIVAVALRAFGLDLVACLIDGLKINAPGLIWRVILIGVCALVGVLGVYVAVIVTPSRARKNDFINLSSDNGGQVRIALPAIRQMAKQAIAGIEGLQDVVINVGEESDAIVVNVSMDVESGVHVPTVTMSMQGAIKRNIERNCGVNVRGVTVTVKDVLPGTVVSETVIIPKQPVEAEAEAVEDAIIETVEENEKAEEETAYEAEDGEEEILLTLDAPEEEDAEKEA